MSRIYNYVGPKEILGLTHNESIKTLINNVQDIKNWLQNTGQKLNPGQQTVATFVIDTNHKLLVAERGIEHVVCAKGKPVLSAGEITFTIKNNEVEISEITNQSTGYCPEPESWKAVNETLTQLQIKFPIYWTTQFIFRRCPACKTINLVKDDWYFCAVCETELTQTWNFQD